jgi:hypothetical protein
MTRIELAEAATRVKATLDSVSSEMGRLLEEMRQRTADQLAHLVEGVEKTLGEFVRRVTRTTMELTEATGSAHGEAITRVAAVTHALLNVAMEAEAAANRLRQVEPPPLKLVTRLEKVSGSLERMATEAERLESRFVSTGDVSSRVNQALTEAAAKLIDASASTSRQQEEAMRQMARSATRLGEVLDEVGRTLDVDQRHLVTIEAQTLRSAQAAQEAQEAARRVLDSLVGMTRGLTEFINSR